MITGKPSIQIKPLDADHYEEWLGLWRGYLNFYNTSLSDGTIKATWEKLLDKNTPILGFAALHNNKLVGIVHVVLHPVT